jgi:hypothetical protein
VPHSARLGTALILLLTCCLHLLLLPASLPTHSNTLLHAAKALNYADIPALTRVKDGVSKAFAAVFFLCRVALPPVSLIKCGLLDGRRLPSTSYVITNGLLLAIYGLQLFWFNKIMRIALGYDSHDGGSGAAASSSPPDTPTAEVTSSGGAAGRRAKGE